MQEMECILLSDFTSPRTVILNHFEEWGLHSCFKMQKFWEQHPEDGGSRFLCSTGNSYRTTSHHILYNL